MTPRLNRWTRLVTAGAATIALTMAIPTGTSSATPQQSGPHWEVVTTGLDSPRGLATLPNGVLVVGEAGHGGAYCAGPDPQSQTCVGMTSRISTVNPWSGKRRTLVGNLLSIGGGEGFTGVDGVSTYGWNVYGIMTGSTQGTPAGFCTGQPAGCNAVFERATKQVGRLIRANGHGGYRALANPGYTNYKWTVTHHSLDPNNPDWAPGDANPYGINAGRHGTWLVDAGSNTLDWVGFDRKVKIVAYLPNPPGPPDQRFPYDAVPTCVVATHNGVYIGDLSGRAWKWSNGHLHQLDTAGLTGSINGCTADRRGNVYFVTMFNGFDPNFGFAPNTGSVTKVDTHGHASMYADGLNLPGGATFGRDGHLYVSNNSICPSDTTGIPPQLCPTSGSIVRFDND